MAEALFWGGMKHLQAQHPRFRQGSSQGLAWRFRRTIHVLDATVIQLLAACLSWAEHKHRKAAAKVYWRLTLRSLLPGFVVVCSAIESEIAKVRVVCRRSRDGVNEWVLVDEEIVLCSRQGRTDHPQRLRRVRAKVVVDGQGREMVFATNNFVWSAWSVAELYRCRWQIEAFFKQTLQLADFRGHSANAVQWQVWMALLVYVLLRFQAWCSRRAHSFSRLLDGVACRVVAAEGSLACLAASLQSWLPGLPPPESWTAAVRTDSQPRPTSPNHTSASARLTEILTRENRSCTAPGCRYGTAVVADWPIYDPRNPSASPGASARRWRRSARCFGTWASSRARCGPWWRWRRGPADHRRGAEQTWPEP